MATTDLNNFESMIWHGRRLASPATSKGLATAMSVQSRDQLKLFAILTAARTLDFLSACRPVGSMTDVDLCWR
jgi:hypothetical protein